MRRLAALQTCLALALAFVVAPFQHVHTGGPGADHDHAELVHAHFYAIGHALEAHDGPELLDPDDDHATARSLDTFTLVLGPEHAPFVPAPVPLLLFAPSEAFQPVEVVEECGHDPPSIDRSIPRAPPA